ncbi:DUF1365 domain-containing protein [Neisseriaceae bacterium TC5R-5]|nr:DUF1365 domain-containing protein [Neisseriaceae bacterium TC5R-5]
MHRRLRPALHRFVYPVFCIRVRLAALAQLNSRWFGVDRWRPLSLRSRDYGPRDGSPLLPWIRRQLAAAGLPCDGEVWLQTFPRLFGYAFNPVSFWYCHNAAGQLCAVLAEVNNTFGEHHSYLLSAADGQHINASTLLHCNKQLHVSPFCPVNGHYRFRFVEKAQHALVRIDYHDAAGALLHTAISGQLSPFTPSNLRRALFRQPLLMLGVISKIHWQAWKLWRKKVPFFGKPQAPQLPISRNQPPP